MMWRIWIVSLIVVAMIISACSTPSDLPDMPTESAPDMANPASEHCIEQGGKLEIRDEPNGQVGYCIFPDGSECEEWAFFRGECVPGSEESAPGGEEDAGMSNPASHHCVDQGGKLEIRDETDDQVGYCIFPDGSECEEWAFFRGECAPGGEESAPGGEGGALEGAYQPLDQSACSDLADAVSETVGAEVKTEQSAFDDTIAGETGTGCQSTAAWTEENFVSTPALAKALREMLETRGWVEDAQYSADGPTGTATAFRLENGLCLLHVSWEPTEDADCPADQPISACELKPEQQLHKVDLNCAQSPSTSAPAAPGGLPNPASQYCSDQGGELEIRDEAEGQVGICIFADGSECDEWAFFRGECAPGDSIE